MKPNTKSVNYLIVLVLVTFFVSGCSGGWFSKKPEGESPENQPKTRKTTAVYYDFEDVLIPMELSIVNDKTVVNFFNNNMLKDNWNIISQLKSPGTTIMVFQKALRTCVITIRDEQIYTYVEVGVAPTVAGQPDFSSSNLNE